MCGLVGYVGPREAKPLLLQGLDRLEHRGYDSAWIALREADRLDYVRAVGNLANLKEAAGRNGSTAYVTFPQGRRSDDEGRERVPRHEETPLHELLAALERPVLVLDRDHVVVADRVEHRDE